LIFGTQAELTKTAALTDPAGLLDLLDLEIAWTGQHRDLVPAAAQDLSADRYLRMNPVGKSAEASILASQPDVVLVQGDTASALDGAKAASGLGIPLVHVEAGLRLREVDEPEEAIRRKITLLADYHVASTQESAQNLLREGVEPARISRTPHLASLYLAYVRSQQPVDWACQRLVSDSIVVTMHRSSTLAAGRQAKDFLSEVATRMPDTDFVVIRRPDPRWWDVMGDLDRAANVQIEDFMRPTRFLDVLSHARAAITDSAGVQQEGFLLGTPVVVMRRESEIPAWGTHIDHWDARRVIEHLHSQPDRSPSAELVDWRRPSVQFWQSVLSWIS